MSNHYAYSLDLARVDFDHADSCRNQFSAYGVGEASYGSFARAVNGSSLVRFSSGDAANVDDVSARAIFAGFEDGQDRLGHVDQAGDVGGNHDVNVLLLNVRRFCRSFDKPPMSSNVSVEFQ